MFAHTFKALCLVAVVGGAQAQTPASGQAILDPAMVIADRGQQLEIYPSLRAASEVSASGRVVQRVSKAATGAAIAPGKMAVVYNHTLNVQGFLTGEITFAVKGSGPPTGFDSNLYPGFHKLVEPNIYVVAASRPEDIPVLQNRLKARTDLEWVEVMVNYDESVNQAASFLKRK